MEGFTTQEDQEMLSRIEKQLKRRFAIGSQVSEHSIVQDFTKQVSLPKHWEPASHAEDTEDFLLVPLLYAQQWVAGVGSVWAISSLGTATVGVGYLCIPWSGKGTSWIAETTF